MKKNSHNGSLDELENRIPPGLRSWFVCNCSLDSFPHGARGDKKPLAYVGWVVCLGCLGFSVRFNLHGRNKSEGRPNWSITSSKVHTSCSCCCLGGRWHLGRRLLAVGVKLNL